MRELCFDTETTGLDPKSGHRLVEIGCVELINRVPSDVTFHRYLNPERDVPVGAFEVHGLSEAFLADKPLFADLADEFLDFVGESQLIIHNASFDMGFINAELAACGRPTIPMKQATDTLAMARAKFFGAPASLDALCRRFGIDNSSRTKHGALLDAELLAEVYIELTGGRQTGLSFGMDEENAETAQNNIKQGNTAQSNEAIGKVVKPVRPARPHSASAEESEAHTAFLKKIKDPIWMR